MAEVMIAEVYQLYRDGSLGEESGVLHMVAYEKADGSWEVDPVEGGSEEVIAAINKAMRAPHLRLHVVASTEGRWSEYDESDGSCVTRDAIMVYERIDFDVNVYAAFVTTLGMGPYGLVANYKLPAEYGEACKSGAMPEALATIAEVN